VLICLFFFAFLNVVLGRCNQVGLHEGENLLKYCVHRWRCALFVFNALLYTWAEVDIICAQWYVNILCMGRGVLYLCTIVYVLHIVCPKVSWTIHSVNSNHWIFFPGRYFNICLFNLWHMCLVGNKHKASVGNAHSISRQSSKCLYHLIHPARHHITANEKFCFPNTLI